MSSSISTAFIINVVVVGGGGPAIGLTTTATWGKELFQSGGSRGREGTQNTPCRLYDGGRKTPRGSSDP
jgi:hypothetical protein